MGRDWHRGFRPVIALVSLVMVFAVGCGWGVGSDVFTNPLLKSGADPWVIAGNGYYYYMNTTGGELVLRKTKDMSDLEHAEVKVVWVPERNHPWSTEVWAPELHRWDGKWYIYFAADDGVNDHHRIYVVENSAIDPMDGTWVLKGKVSDATDRWAIDPNLFEVNGKHYLLWSGWPGAVNGQQNIYIAALSNPWTISSPRTLVSSPKYSWETTGLAVNEGPEALVRNGKVFITFSASGCWTDEYKLGLAQANADTNLLDAASWSKSSQPIFTADKPSGVFAPGHNGFFQSPDGTQDWIIYHANAKAGEGCGPTRTPRIQPFSYTIDGTPHFGVPVSAETLVLRP